MKRIDDATRWSLGIWLVMFCGLCVWEYVGWRRVLNHQGLAAWTQAVGSIAAIAGAFVVASRQHEREVATRRAEHRAELADAVKLRRDLLEHAKNRMTWLVQMLLPHERPDGYYGMPHPLEWQGAIGKLTALKAAIDGIPFNSLQHSDEFSALTEARGGLDAMVKAFDLVSSAAPGLVSATMFRDLCDSQATVDRAWLRYNAHIDRCWS